MASLIDKYFSQPDLMAIETAVKKAEMATAGELVVELSSFSRRWNSERLIHALVFTLVCIILALYFTRHNNWGAYYNTTQSLIWGVAGFIAAYFGWGRFLKREERKRGVVWKRALELFHQLTPTRGHTGVLIFVSLAEEQAAVVADKAIASKLPADYWRKPHGLIEGAMKKGHHVEGIVAAIEMITIELARYFPRQPDDINELPDQPRIID